MKSKQTEIFLDEAEKSQIVGPESQFYRPGVSFKQLTDSNQSSVDDMAGVIKRTSEVGEEMGDMHQL